MRHIRNFVWFAVGVFIAFVWLVPQAYAQTVDPAFNRMINGIIQNAPGVTTTAIPSGVSTVGTGTSNVTTVSGLRIPIPETASANVSRAAIAKAGAQLAKRAIPIAGAAFTAYQIYDAYQDSGLTICPPPDFFCKLPSPAEQHEAGSLWYLGSNPNVKYTSADLACKAANADWHAVPNPGNSNSSWCYRANDSYAGQTVTRSGCGSGYNLVGSSCVAINPVKTPYTDQQLEDAFKQKMVDDPAFAKRYYDAIRADNVRHGVLDNSYVLPPDTPLTVYAPSVTTPETTTKTRTVPLSDGTINTETTKEKTTVTPTTTGTTVGDSKTTYPTTKTETTTTTNNTTNTTTTVTTVTNEAPQTTAPETKTEDPCIANPNRAGCALLGEPPAPQEIPKQDIPVTVTPVPFASAASCPSDISFEAYGARNISWAPFCDTMIGVRPIFLSLASLASAIIIMGFFRV